MKMNKKMTVSLAAIAALVILGVGSAVAFGPHMCMPGKIHKYVLAHIDDRVEELNLTPDQQKQYLDLRAKLEANLQAAATKRQAVFMEIFQGVNQPNPDVRALTGMIKERMNNIPTMMGANLDLLADFYEILNDQQKAQLIKQAQKRMNRAKEFCFDS
jgi:Spy/CpxP family protein refolding chaperone